MYRQVGETWQKVFREKSGDILQRAVLLRRGPTMERIERPSRLDKARMYGYKAKEGVVVIRIRVAAGGMRRPLLESSSNVRFRLSNTTRKPT